MCDNPKNVLNPYYSINSVKDFFGGSDPIRIVIIVYIFLSFILNTIIFITIGFTIKLKNIKFPIATWIMLLVLIMNFFHTFSYLFEWVIKDEDTVITHTIQIKDYTNKIGGLLSGNPKNNVGCTIQGFLLIFTSISQDFLINIFFYLVNSSQVNEGQTKILLLVLGIIFPFIFTLMLGIFGALGLNDEFCYVKKFDYDFVKIDDKECVQYIYYEGFQIAVMIVYAIRVINFIVTAFLLKRIWSFVRQRNKPTIYLIKSIFIPIIQLVTVFIGVIYRLFNQFNPRTSQNLSGVYLVLNTADGVLFPIGFAFQNSLISQIQKLIKGDNKPTNDKPENKTLEFIQNSEAIEEDVEDIPE